MPGHWAIPGLDQLGLGLGNLLGLDFEDGALALGGGSVARFLPGGPQGRPEPYAELFA